MNAILTKDCFWCGTMSARYVLKRTFLETDGKGGLVIKKEYVCSCCGESFITE